MAAIVFMYNIGIGVSDAAAVFKVSDGEEGHKERGEQGREMSQ